MTYNRPESLQIARTMFDRWQGGEGLKEIAAAYGITKAAVHSRMVRAGLVSTIGRRSSREIVAEKMAMPRVVDRDPCIRCGVRGDIGCEHRR